MRASVTAAALVLSAACNSAPTNTCVVASTAAAAAAMPPSSCEGTCASLPLADAGDAGFLFCTVDCTDAGQPACTTAGTTCVSARSKGFAIDKSYCVYLCGSDDAGNDAGSCPSSLFCLADAGVCL